MGKRLGSSLNLSNLFRPAKSPSSSLVLPSDEAESAASSLSSSAAADEAEDELETDGSEVVEQQTCDQRCNLSILVYRRLRRLLRRL